MYLSFSLSLSHAHILTLTLIYTYTPQLSTVQATILPQSPAEAKKHQLASQLFGGLSGPSRPPKSKQHRKSPAATSSFDMTAPSSSGGVGGGGSQLKPPRQVVAATKKPKEPQVDLLLDLQDIDFSSPPAPAPPPGAQEPIAGVLGGAGLGGVMSPPVAGLGVSVGAGGSGGGGGGLLANMEIRGATTQDAKPTTTAPPTTRYVNVYLVQ